MTTTTLGLTPIHATEVTNFGLIDSFATSMKNSVLTLSTSLAAEDGNKRVLTITLKDGLGNALTAADWVWLELISAADASYAISDAGAGEITYNNTTAKKTLLKSSATGVIEVGITDTAAETIIVALGSGPGTKPVVGTTISVVFA